MLLADGSCPRCNPPTRRTTAEKLKLARYYEDEKLLALAHAEIHAGIATGLRPPRPDVDPVPDEDEDEDEPPRHPEGSPMP